MRLDNVQFLSQLNDLLLSAKDKGSIQLTWKRDCPETRAQTNPAISELPTTIISEPSPDTQEYPCLIRASYGRTKLSTVVPPSDIADFQEKYWAILGRQIYQMKKGSVKA